MTAFDIPAIIFELHPDVERRGRLWMRGDSLLLLPTNTGWPIRVIFSNDVATVFTGAASVINIGADDPVDNTAVTEVINAVVQGHAEEYFGPSGVDSLASIGSRVWYEHGERRMLDEGADVRVTFRAPPWA